jgi:hypothetical protein
MRQLGGGRGNFEVVEATIFDVVEATVFEVVDATTLDSHSRYWDQASFAFRRWVGVSNAKQYQT